MTTKADSGAGVFGGLDALSAIASASSARRPARITFRDALRDQLDARGVRLIGAELGRLRGAPVWVVACEAEDGQVHRQQIPVDDPPYERAALVADQIAAQIGKP